MDIFAVPVHVPWVYMKLTLASEGMVCILLFAYNDTANWQNYFECFSLTNMLKIIVKHEVGIYLSLPAWLYKRKYKNYNLIEETCCLFYGD